MFTNDISGVLFSTKHKLTLRGIQKFSCQYIVMIPANGVLLYNVPYCSIYDPKRAGVQYIFWKGIFRCKMKCFPTFRVAWQIKHWHLIGTWTIRKKLLLKKNNNKPHCVGTIEATESQYFILKSLRISPTKYWGSFYDFIMLFYRSIFVFQTSVSYFFNFHIVSRLS
jgi:hypothetical protein